jgi:Domain of unknown function (DUF4419)
MPVTSEVSQHYPLALSPDSIWLATAQDLAITSSSYSRYRIMCVCGIPQITQAIYKPKQAYAATCVTGWIADLFPYLGDPPSRSKNHIFEHPRERWAIPVEKGVSTQAPFGAEARSGIDTRTFPSGLCSVPVPFLLPNGSTRNVDPVAGYLAVEQAPDLSLSPIIGWAVTEPPPAAPVLI